MNSSDSFGAFGFWAAGLGGFPFGARVIPRRLFMNKKPIATQLGSRGRVKHNSQFFKRLLWAVEHMLWETSLICDPLYKMHEHQVLVLL